MIKFSIVGTTGYVGIELLRLLQQHPEAEAACLISNSQAGKALVDLYPQFRDSKFSGCRLVNYEEADLSDTDIVFTALPHGVSQDIVAELYNKGLKIIDMSGDFRYTDTAVYEKWYNEKHKYPKLNEKAVFGLVELNREKIRKADLIANPGCYVTASLLGLIPLVTKNIIDLDNIIIDAKSGVSGAGKSLKITNLFNEVHENMKAYNVATHRHTSEIENVLSELCGRKGSEGIQVLFTPHLIPIKRGILATIYVDLKDKYSQEEIMKIYQEYYQGEPFVQILEDEMPEIKQVVGSNYCLIGLKYDPRTDKLIIITALDNMVKGAAGQAIQNMNVIFGIKENTGLEARAVYP
ncbi:MAG: N-acetyl-gamma-glutamyl-phosphate reductase [Halanaerobiaceae bacterium]|nr:N-acetyl-gamma-glutamyl-phosphate reductase [Halanaerobiaceae bacterium]